MGIVKVDIVNGVAVVGSRKVAEVFGKLHKNVLRDIRDLIAKGIPEDYAKVNFERISYTTVMPNGGVREDAEYQLTLPAFLLLTGGYTGKRHTIRCQTALLTEFKISRI